MTAGSHRAGVEATPAGAASLRVLELPVWLCAEGGGGIQTYLASLGRALAGSNISVSWAALMPGSVSAHAAGAIHLGRANTARWRNALHLRFWLMRNLARYDVVHIHGILGWNFIVGAMACRRLGVPYVVSGHGSLAPAVFSRQGWRAKWAYRAVGRRLLRQAAAIAAASPAEADTVRGVAPGIPVRLVPPGIDVPRQRPDRAEKENDHVSLRVLFVGRLTPIKALPVLIEAVAALHSRGRSAELRIMGSGEPAYIESMRAETRRLGIEQAVTWLGYLSGDPKIQVLRGSDVLVLASESEGFGFAAVEAMAEGLPVIVSEGVGIAATVAACGAGTVVPVNDPGALADALDAYREPAVRGAAGRRAYACARDNYSVPAMTQALEKLYVDAAGRRRP